MVVEVEPSSPSAAPTAIASGIEARREPHPDDDRLRLESEIGALLSERVTVRITDNRHTMVSLRRRASTIVLRLHHMFLGADGATVRALARYLTRGDARSSRRLDAYIAENSHRIRREGRRATRVRSRGAHHDLLELYEELNAAWFGGAVESSVTWGRRGPTRRKRSIRLGTYSDDERLIRIHPVLDQEWVPRFFVAYVLFHEMLHHVVPANVRNGRHHHHGPRFRRLERAYPDYERALAWEKANLSRLLSS